MYRLIERKEEKKNEIEKKDIKFEVKIMYRSLEPMPNFETFHTFPFLSSTIQQGLRVDV